MSFEVEYGASLGKFTWSDSEAAIREAVLEETGVSSPDQEQLSVYAVESFSLRRRLGLFNTITNPYQDNFLDGLTQLGFTITPPMDEVVSEITTYDSGKRTDVFLLQDYLDVRNQLNALIHEHGISPSTPDFSKQLRGIKDELFWHLANWGLTEALYGEENTIRDKETAASGLRVFGYETAHNMRPWTLERAITEIQAVPAKELLAAAKEGNLPDDATYRSVFGLVDPVFISANHFLTQRETNDPNQGYVRRVLDHAFPDIVSSDGRSFYDQLKGRRPVSVATPSQAVDALSLVQSRSPLGYSFLINQGPDHKEVAHTVKDLAGGEVAGDRYYTSFLSLLPDSFGLGHLQGTGHKKVTSIAEAIPGLVYAVNLKHRKINTALQQVAGDDSIQTVFPMYQESNLRVSPLGLARSGVPVIAGSRIQSFENDILLKARIGPKTVSEIQAGTIRPYQNVDRWFDTEVGETRETPITSKVAILYSDLCEQGCAAALTEAGWKVVTADQAYESAKTAISALENHGFFETLSVPVTNETIEHILDEVRSSSSIYVTDALKQQRDWMYFAMKHVLQEALKDATLDLDSSQDPLVWPSFSSGPLDLDFYLRDKASEDTVFLHTLTLHDDLPISRSIYQATLVYLEGNDIYQQSFFARNPLEEAEVLKSILPKLEQAGRIITFEREGVNPRDSLLSRVHAYRLPIPQLPEVVNLGESFPGNNLTAYTGQALGGRDLLLSPNKLGTAYISYITGETPKFDSVTLQHNANIRSIGLLHAYEQTYQPQPAASQGHPMLDSV